MTVNLYLVKVKANETKTENLYYYLTNKTLNTYQDEKAYTLTYQFLTNLETEPEENLYKALKYFFNLRNIDCYYHNTFTKQHYYMPAIYIRKTPNELPTAHTIPSLKISLEKYSQAYKNSHYNNFEKIIERKIYNLTVTTTTIFEKLNTYLKTPNAINYYNYYLKLFPDNFKCFLLLLRDYLSTQDITYPYYLYSYMSTIQLLGYYPKPQKEITAWIKEDRGKDLRQNLILLPFTMSSLIILWNNFNQYWFNSKPKSISEDLI